MLEPFSDNIWTADGDHIVALAGFHYPTRMVVIRLGVGGLFVWSPVTLTSELRTAVDALGVVKHLIAPNSLHHMYLKEWIDAYPEAKVYAPPGLREKRKDIEFDDDLKDAPEIQWADDIDQVIIEGNVITKEVVFFHKDSGTALFVDFLQQLPKDWFAGWRRTVARLDYMLEDEPAVPRKVRMSFGNRKTARAAMKRILAWQVENVIMAHGTPVLGNGHVFLKRAFAWLKP